MRRWGVFVGSATSAMIGYSAWVEFCVRRRTPPPQDFAIGSADDLIQDNLCSGDIVLFSRRWYRHHIPMAIAIKWYQTCYDTEYDHCGVIVQDKFGNPFVFEISPFLGCRLRPFDKRILHSLSQQIIVLPLMPRDEDEQKQQQQQQKVQQKRLLSTMGKKDPRTTAESLQKIKAERKETLFNFARSASNSSASSNPIFDSECIGQLKRLSAAIWIKLFPNNQMVVKHNSCINAELVIASLSCLGIRVQRKGEVHPNRVNDVTIKTILDRDISLLLDDTNTEKMLGSDIMIRTR